MREIQNAQDAENDRQTGSDQKYKHRIGQAVEHLDHEKGEVKGHAS